MCFKLTNEMDILDKNCTTSSNIPKNDKVLQIFRQFIKKYNIKKIIISLSGGVDSMVIAYCATLTDLPVIALHMNYKNREETDEEEKFLKNWCSKYNIQMDVLTFGELRREKDLRDDYEKETRQMRYNFYKESLQKYNAYGIFLGHHANDVAENTFCNVVHGRSLLDLSVIRETSVVMGVNIFRPFRDIEKKYIFEFAHKYGVPYFKDTTPDWSNRGKLRRQIFPVIEDTFEQTFQHKLYELAKQSDELSEIVVKNILQPLIDKVETMENGFRVQLPELLRSGNETIWKLFLQNLLHGHGVSMPKQNVVRMLVDRLKTKTAFKLDLKKDMLAVYSGGVLTMSKI